ncbi:hypothetical protein [Pseudorhodoferax sp.]|uniref:hypothetical protein n=1 Tax=Pseudorhodoferax sp. TaxID=1993553 RepID=UPI0039E591DB
MHALADSAASSSTSTPLPPRHARRIRQLRERLFELQCEPEPDADAIDRLMRQLARLRAQQAPR